MDRGAAVLIVSPKVHKSELREPNKSGLAKSSSVSNWARSAVVSCSRAGVGVQARLVTSMASSSSMAGELETV
jgi:hypothetical protein